MDASVRHLWCESTCGICRFRTHGADNRFALEGDCARRTYVAARGELSAVLCFLDSFDETGVIVMGIVLRRVLARHPLDPSPTQTVPQGVTMRLAAVLCSFVVATSL